MALSGIEIYKMLPRTNCKDCGFPTCLAFAMKLAAKQVELSACPHVSEESKTSLAASAAPPIRLVTLKSNGFSAQAGNETVMYRHEKTFYHKPGLFVRMQDNLPADEITARTAAADAFMVNYVGIELTIDGFAVEGVTGDPAAFSQAVSAVRAGSHRPLILISRDPAVISAGLQAVDGETPLIYSADAANWNEMAQLAKQHEAALAVSAPNLDELAELTEKIKGTGLEDLVVDPGVRDLSMSLMRSTQLRRLALKKGARELGYPVVAVATATTG
jgi:acetyl-CoA decarbonylase/synthase complex subunit gamma